MEFDEEKKNQFWTVLRRLLYEVENSDILFRINKFSNTVRHQPILNYLL